MYFCFQSKIQRHENNVDAPFEYASYDECKNANANKEPARQIHFQIIWLSDDAILKGEMRVD